MRIAAAVRRGVELRFVCGEWQVDRTRSLQSIMLVDSGVANGRGMGGNLRVGDV